MTGDKGQAELLPTAGTQKVPGLHSSFVPLLYKCEAIHHAETYGSLENLLSYAQPYEEQNMATGSMYTI